MIPHDSYFHISMKICNIISFFSLINMHNPQIRCSYGGITYSVGHKGFSPPSVVHTFLSTPFSLGICVRWDVDSVYMHHKFAVVDGRLLITGSLNWTLAAVQSNMENTLITEEPDLVLPFIKEFQRLWERNDPARYHHSSDTC